MKIRLWAAAGAVALAALFTTAPAYAHVTVNPNTAEQGGFAKLTFRMPTERDDANSVKLEVNFPTQTPLFSVSVKPLAGWTYKVERTTLDKPVKVFGEDRTDAVSKITWEGGAVKPGEFQEFEVSAGPLPTVKSMEFKALQTYSSGEVVRWIEERTPGGDEPEHPAPVLTLVKASNAAAAAPTATQSENDKEGDDDGNGLAIAALAVGVVALLAAGASLLRGRPRQA